MLLRRSRFDIEESHLIRDGRPGIGRRMLSKDAKHLPSTNGALNMHKETQLDFTQSLQLRAPD